MYVTTAVVGGVVLLRPFVLQKRPFLRDNIFYVFAVYWALFVLWENQINIGVAIGNDYLNSLRVLLLFLFFSLFKDFWFITSFTWLLLFLVPSYTRSGPTENLTC